MRTDSQTLSGPRGRISWEECERDVTRLLQNLILQMSAPDFTEAPVSKICRILVQGMPGCAFAVYNRETELEWREPVVQEGCTFEGPSADIARRFILFARERLGDSDAVILDEKDTDPFIPEEKRADWDCRYCCVLALKEGSKRRAQIMVFARDEFAFLSNRLDWFRLIAQTLSLVCSRLETIRQLEAQRREALWSSRDSVLSLESARIVIREHTKEVARLDTACRKGEQTYRSAFREVQDKLGELLRFSDVLETEDRISAHALIDSSLAAWIERGCHDPRVKLLSGLRGCGKSTVLHSIRGRVLAQGVPIEQVVILDFEATHFRKFHSVQDVLDYVNSILDDRESGYLFLDEVGLLECRAELLEALVASRRWNVWATTSVRSWIREADRSGRIVLEYRMWTNPQMPRPSFLLEKNWCQIFLHDIAYAVWHADVRSVEMLAEFCSDHLGERLTLRSVSDAFRKGTRKLSGNSLLAYRKLLENAMVIEVSEYYCVATQSVAPKSGVRVFFTDLELRTWRFGAAPNDELVRLDLNRLYLKLRRTYDRVYTPVDADADFVTVEKTEGIRLWTISCEGVTDFRKMQTSRRKEE